MKIPKNIESHLFKQLSNLVSNEKKERMKRLLNSCDINRTLIGDLLIRSLICQKYKINNEEIRFIYNEYGKPFVENFSDFHFNVGIDIEKVSEIEALKLANEFFSEEEFYFHISIYLKTFTLDNITLSQIIRYLLVQQGINFRKR